jgi:hypothetical protein
MFTGEPFEKFETVFEQIPWILALTMIASLREHFAYRIARGARRD